MSAPEFFAELLEWLDKQADADAVALVARAYDDGKAAIGGTLAGRIGPSRNDPLGTGVFDLADKALRLPQDEVIAEAKTRLREQYRHRLYKFLFEAARGLP